MLTEGTTTGPSPGKRPSYKSKTDSAQGGIGRKPADVPKNGTMTAGNDEMATITYHCFIPAGE